METLFGKGERWGNSWGRDTEKKITSCFDILIFGVVIHRNQSHPVSLCVPYLGKIGWGIHALGCEWCNRHRCKYSKSVDNPWEEWGIRTMVLVEVTVLKH